MSNRRDVLKLAGLAPAMMLAQAPAKLPDVVMDASKATVTQETFGELKIYFDGPTATSRHMTAGSLRLKPGASPHPPHQHPEEEFLLLTEGTGEVSIAGQVTQVAPGAMMYCGPNKLHGIVNTGRTPLLFYFYKWM